MTLQQSLFNHLSTYPGLNALVGTRIYPMRPPQQAIKPYVVYALVSEPRIRTYGTNQGGQARVDFTCTSSSYLAADGVRAQVKAALEGFSGVMGGGVNVAAAQQQNAVDMHDDQIGLYHCLVDFMIWHDGT